MISIGRKRHFSPLGSFIVCLRWWVDMNMVKSAVTKGGLHPDTPQVSKLQLPLVVNLVQPFIIFTTFLDNEKLLRIFSGFIEGYSKTALSLISSDQSNKYKCRLLVSEMRLWFIFFNCQILYRQKTKTFEKIVQLCDKLEIDPTTDEWMQQLELIRKFAKQVSLLKFRKMA